MHIADNNTIKLAEHDLSLLRMDVVDLLLIHFPPLLGCIPANCAHMQDQWAALEQLYHAGKARAIGVSNYCKACLQCIMKTATIMPMVNQIQYHVGMGVGFGDDLVGFCAEHNIGVFAYSPLGGGRLLSAGSEFTAIAKSIVPKYSYGPPAQKKPVTPAQVALGWIGQKSAAGKPQMGLVTKSSNPVYLAEDLGIWAGWALDKQDRSALDSLTPPSLACKQEAPGGCCK